MDGFTLTVKSGRSQGKELSYFQEVVRVGRLAANSDLILNDQSISTEHAMITRQGDRFLLIDLGSTNGTFINAIPVQEQHEVELSQNDEVRFGNIGFIFSRTTRKTRSPTPVAGAPAKRSRMAGGLILAAVLLLAAALGLTLFKRQQGAAPDRAPVKDLSDQPATLPADGVYGFLKHQKTHADKAIFVFDGIEGRAQLSYTPGGIDSDTEVTIVLNGAVLGYAPLALGGWGEQETLYLPRTLITAGRRNTLIFDSNRNPPYEETWAVKNLSLAFFPDHECNMKEGQRFLDLGQEMVQERHVQPRNLSLAVDYYSEAMAYSAGCVGQTALYQEAEQLFIETSEMRDTKIRSLFFSARKQESLGNEQQTAAALEEILRLMPDRRDARVVRAMELLEAQQRRPKAKAKKKLL